VCRATSERQKTADKVVVEKQKREREKEREKEKATKKIAMCVTKLVETRLNERARQRNFCEQLTGRQRVIESDAA
jgi:hypothetical protein